MADLIPPLNDSNFVYHVLRYTSDLVRDEWVNIGVILFDPLTGALRLRLVEEQDEYARIRRLQPTADEDTLRGFRDHLEDRFTTFLRNRRAEQGGTLAVGEELQKLMENWNNTLSNGLQLAPRNGVYLSRGPHAARLLLPPKWHARLCTNAQRFPRSFGLQAVRIHRGPQCHAGAFRLRVCGGDRHFAAA